MKTLANPKGGKYKGLKLTRYGAKYFGLGRNKKSSGLFSKYR